MEFQIQKQTPKNIYNKNIKTRKLVPLYSAYNNNKPRNITIGETYTYHTPWSKIYSRATVTNEIHKRNNVANTYMKGFDFKIHIQDENRLPTFITIPFEYNKKPLRSRLGRRGEFNLFKHQWPIPGEEEEDPYEAAWRIDSLINNEHDTRYRDTVVTGKAQGLWATITNAYQFVQNTFTPENAQVLNDTLYGTNSLVQEIHARNLVDEIDTTNRITQRIVSDIEERDLVANIHEVTNMTGSAMEQANEIESSISNFFKFFADIFSGVLKIITGAKDKTISYYELIKQFIIKLGSGEYHVFAEILEWWKKHMSLIIACFSIACTTRGMLSLTSLVNGIRNPHHDTPNVGAVLEGTAQKLSIGEAAVWIPVAFGTFGYFLITNNTSMGDFKTYITSFLSLIKNSSSITSFVSDGGLKVDSIIKVLPEYIQAIIYSLFPSLKEMHELLQDPELGKHLNLLRHLDERSHFTDIIKNSTKLRNFLDSYNYFDNLFMNDEKEWLHEIYHNELYYMRHIYEDLHKNGYVPGHRFEPFCVWIYGQPGVGKSLLCSELAKLFNYPEHQHCNHTAYVKNTANKFWDNYHNQRVCILNDYLQFTDRNEEEILIALKDSTDYLCDVASVDDPIIGKKGDVRFTSHVILVSSNVNGLISSRSVVSYEAFNRRRNLVVRMIKRGDINIMDKNFTHASFQFYNPITNEAIGDECTYAELKMILLQGFNNSQQLNKDFVGNAQGDVAVMSRMFLKFHFANPQRIGIHEALEGNRLARFVDRINNDIKDYTESKETMVVAAKEFESAHKFVESIIGEISVTEADYLSRVLNEIAKEVQDEYFECEYISPQELFRLTNMSNPITQYLYKCQWFLSLRTKALKFTRFFRSVFSLIPKDVWITLGVAAALMTFSLCLDEVFKIFVRRDQNTITIPMAMYAETSIASGDNITSKSRLLNKLNLVPSHDMQVLSMGGTAQVACDESLNKVVGNTYKLVIVVEDDKEKKIFLNNGLVIGGSYLLCPKHFLYANGKLLEKGLLIITNEKDTYKVPINQSMFVCSELEDLAIINCGMFIPHHKGVLNKLYDKVEDCPRKLDSIFIKRSTDDQVRPILYNTQTSITDLKYQYTDDFFKYTFPHKYLMYIIQTEAGDCGSIIVSEKCTHILGLHVASVEHMKLGQGVMLLKSNVMPLLKSIVTKCGYVYNEANPFQCQTVERKGKAQHLEIEGLSYVGSLENDERIFISNKTEIGKSIFYECLQPHDTEPSVLTPNDKRIDPEFQGSPLLKGMKKFGIKRGHFGRYYPEIARGIKLLHKDTLQTKYSRRILSEHEVLNGTEVLERFNMDSSPGFPLSKGRIEPGKRDFIKFDKYWSLTPKMREDITEKERKIMSNEEIELFWVSCVKDERRSLEKVRTANSRVFIMAPFFHTYLCKKYFGSFIEAYLSTKYINSSALGINPYSMEWNMLWESFKGFDLIDGDLKSCDTTVLNDVYNLLAETIDLFYYNQTPEEKQMRHFLIKEAMCSKIIVLGDIFQKFGGNPSGWLLTLIVNDFALKSYYLYFTIRVFELNGVRFEMDTFFTFCKLIVFGDDNVFGVRGVVKSMIPDPNIIVSIFKEISINITPADKKKPVFEFMPIEKVSFLKNSIARNEHGYWVARLEERVIREMVSWTRDNSETIQQTIDSCLRFSYFYGPKFYQAILNQLREHVINNELVFKDRKLYFLEYKDLDNEYYNRREFDLDEYTIESFVKRLKKILNKHE